MAKKALVCVVLATVGWLVIVAAPPGMGAISEENRYESTAVTNSVRNGGARTSAIYSGADVSFAQSMVAHHQEISRLAAAAQNRASDAEVRNVASRIAVARQREIRTLTDWLGKRDSPVLVGAASGELESTVGMSDEDFARLCAEQGMTFDRRFLEMLIAQFGKAAYVTRGEQAKGSSTEAKAIAAKIERNEASVVAELQKILDRLAVNA